MTPTILITGAGAGIGRATARAFLDAGWEVALLGRRRETLEETAQGRPARILVCDVGDPVGVEAAFATLPRLDVLFNNAGIAAKAAPIDEIPVQDWLDLNRTNITGMFLCARAAFGLMRGHQKIADQTALQIVKGDGFHLERRPAQLAANVPGNCKRQIGPLVRNLHEPFACQKNCRRRLGRHGVGRAWFAIQKRQFAQHFPRTDRGQHQFSALRGHQ